MIVLDRNVISELTKPRPSETVVAWLNESSTSQLWLTSISLAELLYGIERLPDGRRKAHIGRMQVDVIARTFSTRVVPFDEVAARQYAILVAHRQALGRPISVQDAQIAAICRANAATLATRNTPDFEHTGVPLINPWEPTAI